MERFKGSAIKISILMSLLIWHFSLNVYAQAPKTYNLSLEEVTQIAISNNFDIQLAKYDAWIKRTDKDKAESIYATVFSGEVGYNDDQSKRTSTIFGTKTVTNEYDIGLEKRLPTGTTVGVDMANTREATNSSFTTSPVTHDSSLGVFITQQLGKNFLGIQDRGNVKITLIDIENSEYASFERIEQYLGEVQAAYWSVVLADERVVIQNEMVAQAKRLFDLHQEKIKDGLAEKPDVLASEANYRKQQNILKLLKNDSRAKVNQLALLLNITENDFDIVPTDEFNDSEYNIRMKDALRAAFNNRQDYKRVRNEIKAKDIKLSMKKNNLWPEINLEASLIKNGLGDHFPEAVEHIGQEDNPNLFAGLTVSFPLLNTEARAELKEAELEKARALLNLKYIERKIFIEISDLVRDVNVLNQIAVDDREIARLQQQKFEEEEKRFNRGRSNTDTIIRFQEDAIQARDEEITALFNYQAALIQLEKKSGVLLKKYWEGEL